MMTPIEKVKATLKKGIELLEPFEQSGFLGNEALNLHRQTLRDLNGMVIVPSEPTDAMLNGDFSELDMDDYCANITYKAMIAPYLPKGDE